MFDAGGQAVVFNGQAPSLLLAGRVSEEDRVVEFAVEDAYATVIAAAPVFCKILFPEQLACF